MNRIDVDAVNALRVPAADEVQKANSGNPVFRWVLHLRHIQSGHTK